jgi:hypothetical protein
MAPLSDTALLDNEVRSRGIIVEGHESDRLIVALSEVEPAGGVIVVANTSKRPDFRVISERNNRRIVRQLMSIRPSDWKKEIVDTMDFRKMGLIVDKEVEIAKGHDAPVILYPFGPKPLIFSAAFQMCAEYPEGSWFVYPVPTAYDVNYSEGEGRSLWLIP